MVSPVSAKHSALPGMALVTLFSAIGGVVVGILTHSYGYGWLTGGAAFLVGQYLNGRIVAWLNDEPTYWSHLCCSDRSKENALNKELFSD